MITYTNNNNKKKKKNNNNNNNNNDDDDDDDNNNNNDYRDATVLEKLRFQNIFRVQENEKQAFSLKFEFLRFEELRFRLV